jgi:hypothetical protein
MLNRIWLICISWYFASAQTYFNCNSSQTSYFKNERILFGLDDTIEPFESNYLTKNISYFPTSCIDDNNAISHYPGSIHFIKQYLYEQVEPIHINRYIPGSVIGMISDFIWSRMGYIKVSYNSEQFWYLENKHASDIVLFFHGINVANGLENLYLLNKLSRNNSIYVSIYQPSFIVDYFYYNTTYSQHIDNIISFIKTELSDKSVSLIGNSYGSIRVTTLCKRYDCSGMSNIILTDPVNLNFPYSKIFVSLFHGVFSQSNLTETYRMISTVNLLRDEKQYSHMENNFDWYEWTLDTPFMNYYKDILTLVIGKYDDLLSVDESSYAMTKICRVIYTNTLHGFVLFTDFLDDIPAFKSGICSIHRCA